MPAGNFLTFVDDNLTIMRPMKSTFARGLSANQKQQPTFSIRLSDEERGMIEDAAKALAMDKTAFIRWCAVASAMEIIKQKREYDKLVSKGVVE